MNKKPDIFGLHAVTACLQRNPASVQKLMILTGKADAKTKALLALAKTHHIPLQYLSRHELDEYCQSDHHQGIVAVCASTQHQASQNTPTRSEADLEVLLQTLTTPPFLLILDGVQDPHNLGACLRTADAAGVHAVIAPKDKSVGLTATVYKVASGAAEHVPFIQVTNLSRTIKALKNAGIWLYGATEEAEHSLYQTQLTCPLAIVLGAEGTGLRHLTKAQCDVLVHIPMQGSVSSLNVSVATGVILFEAVRQRRIKKV